MDLKSSAPTGLFEQKTDWIERDICKDNIRHFSISWKKTNDPGDDNLMDLWYKKEASHITTHIICLLLSLS